MRQVFAPTPILYNEEQHRMLEIEADDPDELEAMVQTALSKGWFEYVRGHRPADPKVQAVLFLKPVSPAA